MTKENKCYVYLHRYVENGEVFYVGKGTAKRSNTRSGRSKVQRTCIKLIGTKKHSDYVYIFAPRAGLTAVVAYPSAPTKTW